MLVTRHYSIAELAKPGKALVIFGPRRVGKTTLIKEYLKGLGNDSYRFLDGGDIFAQGILSTPDLQNLQKNYGDRKIFVLDEAQKIQNIGETLKLMIDHIPDMVMVVTGSASFDLAGQIGEPLLGRKNTITLYPLAGLELRSFLGLPELRRELPDMLVYGSYPEVFTSPTHEQKQQLLLDIVGSSLLKDILELDKVKSSKRLVDLLRLIAHQVGSEVSINELATQLEMENRTVARYLDLLEKSFILINVRGFSRNLRKEISKKSKYYFYDVGIRNALINNFNPLHVRDDVGKLWENYLIIERLKFRAYTGLYANAYFWRTWDGQEIDLVEERGGKLFGYEFKWGNKTPKSPRDWFATYGEAEYQVINQDNFLEFITHAK